MNEDRFPKQESIDICLKSGRYSNLVYPNGKKAVILKTWARFGFIYFDPYYGCPMQVVEISGDRNDVCVEIYAGNE